MSTNGTTSAEIREAIEASIAGRSTETTVQISIDEFDDIYTDLLADNDDADHDGPATLTGDNIGDLIDMWGVTEDGDEWRIKLRITP